MAKSGLKQARRPKVAKSKSKNRSSGKRTAGKAAGKSGGKSSRAPSKEAARLKTKNRKAATRPKAGKSPAALRERPASRAKTAIRKAAPSKPSPGKPSSAARASKPAGGKARPELPKGKGQPEIRKAKGQPKIGKGLHEPKGGLGVHKGLVKVLTKTARKAKERAARLRGEFNPSADWEDLMAMADLDGVRPYTLRGEFHRGEVIQHKVFGLGIVVNEVGGGKIQVSFKDGVRLLVSQWKL